MCNFDCCFNRRFRVRLSEKFAYTGQDFADEGIVLSRSFVHWRNRNPENRNYDDVSVEIEIDGERVKEGVIVPGWDVISVGVKRHVTELMGEVNSDDSPCADA